MKPLGRIALGILLCVSGVDLACAAEIDLAALDANHNQRIDDGAELRALQALANAQLTPVGTSEAGVRRARAETPVCSFWQCVHDNSELGASFRFKDEATQDTVSGELSYQFKYKVSRNFLASTSMASGGDLYFRLAPRTTIGRDRKELTTETQVIRRVEIEPWQLVFAWGGTPERHPELWLGLGYSWSYTRAESALDGSRRIRNRGEFTWAPGITFPSHLSWLSYRVEYKARFDNLFSDRVSDELFTGAIVKFK